MSEKWTLDLIPWSVPVQELQDDEDGQKKVVQTEYPYPVCDNLSMMLRAQGVFQDTESVVEAISLAKSIRDSENGKIDLDKHEIEILKKCMDAHLKATTEKRANFGGTAHEELIMRIHKLWKSSRGE